MRVLALDAARARCAVAVVFDDALRASRVRDGARGNAAALPAMTDAALAEAGIGAAALDLLAVTVGPGSFTGLRAALSLAHGLALGSGVPLVGVMVAEALAAALPPLGGREAWIALDGRRGQVFLDRGAGPRAVALDALPAAPGPVAVAGDAAVAVAAALAARGGDVLLTDMRLPDPRLVAVVGRRRAEGALPPLEAQPLYAEAAVAKLPSGGLRPAPR